MFTGSGTSVERIVTAAALIRARIVGVVCWIIAVVVTAAIGVSRVYSGMHHPSDVAVGVLLGLAVLGVAFVAVRAGQTAAAERRRRREPPAGRSLDPELTA